MKMKNIQFRKYFININFEIILPMDLIESEIRRFRIQSTYFIPVLVLTIDGFIKSSFFINIRVFLQVTCICLVSST